MFQALGFAVGKELSPIRSGIRSDGTSTTVLRREADGTVTVVSLADPYTPILTRQADGSVKVEGA